MARTIRPGSAPTYVRRWPRISASSRTPPRATRTNLRPRVRATDSPSDVLPTPGGPASRITAPDPRPPTTVRPRDSRRARPPRAPVRGADRTDTPGRAQHRVEPGPDPPRLGVLVAGALQLADLAQRRLADRVGQIG